MATVGLDLGHGKNVWPPSKGIYKNGKGYAEYDANSRVGRVLKGLLEDAGHTVIMAQPFNANNVPLSQRTNIYFSKKVDLIISLHANANGDKSASGYAAFYWHNHNPSKKFADLYEDELKKNGFKLWGGSRPSRPNDWSNFHMCRVPASRNIPSILVENGFFTNDGDFEWIFGSKKHKYAEACATMAFNAIQRFLGLSTVKPKQTNPAPKEEVKSNVSKPSTYETATSHVGMYVVNKIDGLRYYNKPSWSDSDLAGTVNKGQSFRITGKWKVSNGYQYEVNESGNKRYITASDKYISVKKSIQTQSKPQVSTTTKVTVNKNVTTYKGISIIDYLNLAGNKHLGGSSFSNRRRLAKQYGIKNYIGTGKQNLELLNKLRGLSNVANTSVPKQSKTITQMANEIINNPKVPQGHDARRKWLGIDKATYEKVRAEVNRRLK